MKDTPAAIERKFRQMLLQRSGAERLKMGCSMHATARALALAALSQNHPGVRPGELKRLLFLHFYGADFKPEQRARVAAALARSRRLRPKTRAQVAERAARYGSRRPAKKRK